MKETPQIKFRTKTITMYRCEVEYEGKVEVIGTFATQAEAKNSRIVYLAEKLNKENK